MIKIEMWIAEVIWHDNSRQYFGPFSEYEAGIKAWSAEFSYRHSDTIESIGYYKLEKPKIGKKLNKK